MKSWARPPSVRRDDSLRATRQWLHSCHQPLLIIGPPYCGKSYFARQLQSESDCVAAHFCRIESPESSEAATLLRSISSQLVKRFPNLVLPTLSTITLLADYNTALEHYLTLPLASLPIPNKPVFIIIDDIQPHIYDLLFTLLSSLPIWLRLVLTTRPLSPSHQYRFDQFHHLILSEGRDELSRFIELRLPQCISADVIQSCDDSWFFVDQLYRGIDSGLLLADSVPCSTKDLLEDLCLLLPIRLPVYLMLIKSSRHPPSFSQLLAVSQLVINDNIDVIHKELDQIYLIMETRDPIILSGSWIDIDGDLSPYHSAWAEFYKTKRRKTPQDIILLAYHLAHSSISPLDAIRTLSSVGAANLILGCSVIDIPTSILLSKAGTEIQDFQEKDDFVYLCSNGNYKQMELLVSTCNEEELSLGLLAASARGNLNICEKILETRKETAHFVSNNQWNPLRSAACNNHPDVIKLLIKHGVNVDDCGQGGRTALRAAAWAGHLDVVEVLLGFGANIEHRDSEDRTALMAASFMNHHLIVNLLLQHGADHTATDSAGATALHLCLSSASTSQQHVETVNILLKNGNEVNHSDAHGRKCIHLAAYHGDCALAVIIERTDNIDIQDSLGRTALMLAASQGKQSSVELLIEKGADIDSIDGHGRTALQLAAIHGHLSVVDLLLTLGADEDHKDNDGAVALHYAVIHEDVQLSRALATSSTVSSLDRHGNHPLIIAAQNNNVQIVHELLNLGAPVEKQSLDGTTALRAAALAGHTRVVQELADWTSDWIQSDSDGTPLVHSLLINRQTAMAELLLTVGAFSSSRDAHGRTCAHVVCSTNDLCAARMLRRLGASFESSDSGGRSPLLSAVWAGHLTMAAYLLDTVAANPNAVDLQGASALSVAAQLGHRDLVVLLLRFGAEPSLRDEMGRTALDVARISGHDHIAQILKAASGSADSSGFGSMPNSPMDTKSLGRKSFRKSQKLTITSPRQVRKIM